ncbi:MAG: tetratricopeptide repeat protein, partial [Muribaculaceae bacterium]|nr:tetratricopeptide repeat protein [Muribaculaceae bacterium]
MFHKIFAKLVVFILLTSTLHAISQINTEQVMRVGQNAMYFEDYVLSIQYFNQAIRSKPYLAQPYFYRAIAKFNLDDFAGAEEDASKAIEINPFLADAWEVRAVARQNQGKYAEAVADYDEALKALPRNRQIMFNRSMALGAMKQIDEADSAFTQLIEYYPSFDNAYLGRAMVRLEKADTLAALNDVENALQLNPNAYNGYLMRSDIALKFEDDKEKALDNIDQAIKLKPKETVLYINRAYLRYINNDYFGSMADYTYALQLEPANKTALFNRALLRTEVSDFDNALSDYNQILSTEPDNDLALYNRAVILAEKGEFDLAIQDITRLMEIYPTLGTPYFLRSEWYMAMGQTKKAKADYEKGEALTNARVPVRVIAPKKNAFDMADNRDEEHTEELSQEEVAQRFNSLLTVENATHFDEEFNNASIRGKVQDRNINIEIEPTMDLTFYAHGSELKQKNYYIKEVDDLNATRILRNPVLISNRPVNLTDEEAISRHFASVEYFNSYISTHEPRAIDYIGRALDFVTLKNYPAAIADLDKAIALTPDHPVAYLLRAQARYHLNDDIPANVKLQMVISDLDKVLELSPRTAIAWFNKGNALFDAGDLTSALAAYTKAIELQPDMGEAFYNRGYIYLKLGNQERGVADLSKSG